LDEASKRFIAPLYGIVVGCASRCFAGFQREDTEREKGPLRKPGNQGKTGEDTEDTKKEEEHEGGKTQKNNK
jgi:hypothetical protein